MYVCIINLGKARAKNAWVINLSYFYVDMVKLVKARTKKLKLNLDTKQGRKKLKWIHWLCCARAPRPLAPSILVTFNQNRHVINHVIDHMTINYLLLLHPGRSTAVTTSPHFHNFNLFLLGIVIYFNQSSQYKLSYSSITWCSRLNSGGADEHEPIIRLTLQPPTTYPRILKPSHYISNPKSNSIHYKSTQQ